MKRNINVDFSAYTIWFQIDVKIWNPVKSMEIYERIFKEGAEIVEWVKGTGVKLVSVMLFGSAVRGWREPEDLDVLVVVDELDRWVDELCSDFCKVDLGLSEKYGLYPELIVLRKD